MASNTRRIAVLSGLLGVHQRETIRGVAAYAAGVGNWELEILKETDESLRSLRHLQPHGIFLENSISPRLLGVARRSGAALVGLVANLGLPSVHEVDADDLAIGVLAADYMAERGVTNAGYLHHPHRFSELRRAGFTRRLAERGVVPSVVSADARYPGSHGHPGPTVIEAEGERWGWSPIHDVLVQWVQALPKPAGVFACNDLGGRHVLKACQAAGMRVPQDVMVVAVDNDPLVCELVSPSLSSIAVPWVEIGRRAAGVMDALLAGQVVAGRTVLPPTGVVTRRSSDLVTVQGNDAVATAVQFIRDNAHRAIQVADVAERVPVGRRSLEKQFRAARGHSLLQEIRRAHVGRAQMLLSETDLKMSTVARRSGFGNASRLAVVFRAITGTSPTDYRRQFRTAGRD
jgi:LacI family transcriptional regulator